MFNVPQSKTNEFAKLYQTHRVQISASDVYFQNIRMLNGRHTILDRKTFQEFYRVFTSDIELQTSPIDAFIPCNIEPTDTPDEIDPADLMKQKLFLVNREVPEYERIKKRVTTDELKNTLNETHPVIMAMTTGKATYDDVIDDIFIYWCLFKYIEQIEAIRLQIFSNMTPLIEYVVKNIDEFAIKRYLRISKIKEDKVNKHQDMMFFGPDYSMICKFYMDEKNAENNIPVFDLDNLINRLMSNIDITGDKYIILGLYLIASFAVADFKGPAADTSECVQYVRNVISVV